MRRLIATVPIVVALVTGQALPQQTDPAQVPPPKVAKPAPKLTFADKTKQYLQKIGATIDPSKSDANMVVSNYADPKGGKTTIVITNDKRKNLVGFYVYNFGSLKNATNKEEVYKYLLSTNDEIILGSFFVDGDDDIGYKYLVGNVPALSSTAFNSIYRTMAAVARDRRSEIRQLLGLPTSKEDKPADVKKAAADKPPTK